MALVGKPANINLKIQFKDLECRLNEYVQLIKDGRISLENNLEVFSNECDRQFQKSLNDIENRSQQRQSKIDDDLWMGIISHTLANRLIVKNTYIDIAIKNKIIELIELYLKKNNSHFFLNEQKINANWMQLLNYIVDECASIVRPELTRFCISQLRADAHDGIMSVLKETSLSNDQIVAIADGIVRAPVTKIMNTLADAISVAQQLQIECEEGMKEIDSLRNKIGIHELTGLDLRRKFIEKIRRQSGCIVYLDCNGLGLLNKIFGQEVGNLYILHVASILKSSVRKRDAVASAEHGINDSNRNIIAIDGGDEFLLFLIGENVDPNIPIERIIDHMRNVPIRIPIIEKNKRKISAYLTAWTYKAKNHLRCRISECGDYFEVFASAAFGAVPKANDCNSDEEIISLLVDANLLMADVKEASKTGNCGNEFAAKDCIHIKGEANKIFPYPDQDPPTSS